MSGAPSAPVAVWKRLVRFLRALRRPKPLRLRIDRQPSSAAVRGVQQTLRQMEKR